MIIRSYLSTYNSERALRHHALLFFIRFFLNAYLLYRSVRPPFATGHNRVQGCCYILFFYNPLRIVVYLSYKPHSSSFAPRFCSDWKRLTQLLGVLIFDLPERV
ncbi:hypothetical protein L211DRAFT_175196 [Terfezia boudieri ATCC MYA-4762]|uniref:Uncharacterized protein n=1 Tax=Terfezia boudieri ATCC MYA-4762 TaxID=1051890 RepID=A0A3N4LNS1_9PEZI|nr:hypothetical protein L211DRAFT_175196 [Terfezia boudieri ATCC MYA-4762]